MAARTAASSVVSAARASTRRPWAAASCRAAASSLAGSRASRATSAPSAASALAMAYPMPRLPPVTTARFPVS